MRWSREGLDSILQIRAAIASNDWDLNWRTVIASIELVAAIKVTLPI